MKNKKTKLYLIGTLFFVTLFTIVGYATLQSYLNISGVADISTTWDIRIESITKESSMGLLEEIETPTFNGITANFHIGLKKPGDRIWYRVSIKNYGNVSAYLHSISGMPESSDDGIYFYVYESGGPFTANTNPAYASRLAPNASHNIIVLAGWEASDTSVPAVITKKLSLQLNYQQDNSPS